MNGVRVGDWVLPARGDMQWQYDPTWVNSPAGRPLSLSLPFAPGNPVLKGAPVAHYFDNLLPDSDTLRKRVAQRFRTGSTEPFALLKAIGRDCVGAVQLLDENETPGGFDRIEGVALTEDDIERLLLDVVSSPGLPAGLDTASDLRISIAGAQEKTALLWWSGRWHRPLGVTPTTHILKLPLGRVGGRQADFSTSVDNEWLCLRLLRAYGLNVPDADIATFGRQRVLVVTRFDRRPAPNQQWLMRLPQEDFCQVTGCSPLRKYESDGGPGLLALASALRQSVDAEADLRTLMTAQVLFWLLRAPDGHAKNFSIHLLPGGRFRLAPLYDVMSAYPVLGEEPNQWHPRELTLAMALLGKNRHNRMERIQRRHFNSTARQLGMGPDAEILIESLLARTSAAVQEVNRVLPAGFSAQVADAVLGGLERAAQALAGMPPELAA